MNRLKESKAKHGGKENREHFGQIRGEQKLNGVTNIIINSSALIHCGNDSGKVIVGKHHIGNIFCYIGTGDTHTHTDIGIFN